MIYKNENGLQLAIRAFDHTSKRTVSNMSPTTDGRNPWSKAIRELFDYKTKKQGKAR